MKRLLFLLVLAALAFGQMPKPGSASGAGSANVSCVGSPGNTLGLYRQQCQVADTGAIWACNNAAACTVAADWVAVGGVSGTFNPRGVYTPGTSYSALDLVEYGGVSYAAMQACASCAHQPDVSPIYWATPGPQGVAGALGDNGTDGTSVTATAESAGANCTYGGIKFTSSSGTNYACNGAPGAGGSAGSNGTNGQSVTVSAEGAGANCAYAGEKLVSASGTAYVCNGAPGTNGTNGTNGSQGAAGANGQSVTVTSESAGVNCATGGWKLVSASGTAYVCNGATGSQGVQGATGSQGTNGANGTNGQGYTATSATSLTVAASGTKTFSTQGNLAYTTGARVRATSAGTGEYMEGVVTSYTAPSLVVLMDHASGSGTHTDWDLNLAGDVGPQGPAGSGSGDMLKSAYDPANKNAQLAALTDVPSAYGSTPAMDGTGSSGVSGSWARGDHAHPTDTSRAAASAAITIGGTSVALGGSTSGLPVPGPIGGTTPNTGAFTSLTVTGNSAYGSSPPPAPAGGTGYAEALGNGTAPTSNCVTSGVDCLYYLTTAMMLSLNGTAAAPVVQGPTSATSANFASFNGTGGAIIQDSGKSAASFEVPLTFSSGLNRSTNTITTDSTTQSFLAAGALTCGASTNGKIKVHTTPLQYCDNAATPALQYAAYGNSSGVANSAAALSAAYIDWNASSGGAFVQNKPTLGALAALGTATIATGGTNATSAAAGQTPNTTSGTASSWTYTPTLGDSSHQGTLTLADGGQVTLNGSSSGSAAIGVSATGVLALPSSTTATNAALTTPSVTTSIADSATGTATVGVAAHPFGSLYLGNAATNNIRLTGTSAAARVMTIPDAGADYSITYTVASGTLALATSSIAAGACQAVSAGTTNSVAATGVATTDAIIIAPNATVPTSTTGGWFPPSSSGGGGLSMWWYPTAGYVNVNVCNWTAGAITPSAVTLNWKVVR